MPHATYTFYTRAPLLEMDCFELWWMFGIKRRIKSKIVFGKGYAVVFKMVVNIEILAYIFGCCEGLAKSSSLFCLNGYVLHVFQSNFHDYIMLGLSEPTEFHRIF